MRTTDRLAVLMYHAVGSPMPDRLADLTVPQGLLAEQLEALRRAGYELLGLTEALAAHASGRRAVALTFDDGFRDFLEAGLEVLHSVAARATLYVPSRTMGATASWLPAPADRLPLLGADEVGAVAGAGIEIGSHGAVHVPMDVLPPTTAIEQLAESRAELERVIERPVVSFCYPHGYHSRRLRHDVRLAGYDNACAIGHRLHDRGDGPFAVSRLLAGPQHDGAALLDLVERGSHSPVPALKRAATPAWRVTRRAALRTAGVTWT